MPSPALVLDYVISIICSGADLRIQAPATHGLMRKQLARAPPDLRAGGYVSATRRRWQLIVQSTDARFSGYDTSDDGKSFSDLRCWDLATSTPARVGVINVVTCRRGKDRPAEGGTAACSLEDPGQADKSFRVFLNTSREGHRRELGHKDECCSRPRSRTPQWDVFRASTCSCVPLTVLGRELVVSVPPQHWQLSLGDDANPALAARRTGEKITWVGVCHAYQNGEALCHQVWTTRSRRESASPSHRGGRERHRHASTTIC